MEEWIAHSHMWLRRTALLHQVYRASSRTPDTSINLSVEMDTVSLTLDLFLST